MNKTHNILLILVIIFTLGFTPVLMVNAFAAPFITAYVADDPNNPDGEYSDGDTLTINLSEASNVTTGIVRDVAITGNFSFANGDPLTGGADFTGEWTSSSVLVITMNTIGTSISLGSSSVAADPDNNIGPISNNTDNTVMGSNTTAVTLTGDFGIVSSSNNNKGGDGCNGDCEEPTLGVDSTGKRFVTNGFTYNGHSVDVERFFTPYPLITAEVGKLNTAEFKIYENQGPQNIRHFSFAYGLGQDQVISESKAMIELDIAFDGTETVTVTDPENALDNVSVKTSTGACMPDSGAECLIVTINHIFREPLDFNIVATDVWDTKRSGWQNYYNHGIEVVGPSMNPPDQYDGIHKGQIYHLTETSKTTAVDEYGNTWSLKYGQWSMDYVKPDRPQDAPTQIMTRLHSDFANYKLEQIEKAIPILLEYCPHCLEDYSDFKDSHTIEYPDTFSKLQDPKVLASMYEEVQKAEKRLQQIYEQSYPTKVFD